MAGLGLTLFMTIVAIMGYSDRLDLSSVLSRSNFIDTQMISVNLVIASLEVSLVAVTIQSLSDDICFKNGRVRPLINNGNSILFTNIPVLRMHNTLSTCDLD